MTLSRLNLLLPGGRLCSGRHVRFHTRGKARAKQTRQQLQAAPAPQSDIKLRSHHSKPCSGMLNLRTDHSLQLLICTRAAGALFSVQHALPDKGTKQVWAVCPHIYVGPLIRLLSQESNGYMLPKPCISSVTLQLAHNLLAIADVSLPSTCKTNLRIHITHYCLTSATTWYLVPMTLGTQNRISCS